MLAAPRRAAGEQIAVSIDALKVAVLCARQCALAIVAQATLVLEIIIWPWRLIMVTQEWSPEAHHRIRHTASSTQPHRASASRSCSAVNRQPTCRHIPVS
jgi:hypothetical protein